MTTYGTYTFQDYTVVIADVTQTRTNIIYFNLDGSELTRWRYYPEDPDLNDAIYPGYAFVPLSAANVTS